MDENIAQNLPQEPAPKPVSYSRSNNSSPNFFDKFSSFFTKKTVAVLVILVLIIGVGAATIAVQRSTEIRQRASLSLAWESLGDVNFDGVVNPVDSNLILNFAAGTITDNLIKSKIQSYGDVNGDGVVNPVDSNLILNFAAGTITTFAGCSKQASTLNASLSCGTGAATTPQNNVNVNFSWTKSADTTISNQQLDYSLVNDNFQTGPPWSGSYPISPSVNSYSATGYPQGVPYWWRIRTMTQDSSGTNWHYSQTASLKTIACTTTTPTLTPPPDCNSSNPGSCTPCVAGPNTCDGTGTQKCILDSLSGSPAGTKCNIVKPPAKTCTGAPDNCLLPNTCINRACVLPNGSPAPTPSINCDSGGSCTACVAASNTCNGTGTKRCILDSLAGSPGTACINVSVNNSCTGAPANCSLGNFCQSGTCVSNGTTPPPGTITPTGTQGGTQLALSIGLDGLGSTGDNGGPNGTRSVPTPPYKSPKRPTRNVTVEIFNGNSNTLVGTKKTGTVTYANGVFTGTVDLGSGFTTGTYNIKVKSDGYLRRQILGVTLTAGQTNTASPISLFAGDINGDNVINILDINILISCSTTTLSIDNHGACGQYAALSDLDDNGVVDLLDANLLIREFNIQNGD